MEVVGLKFSLEGWISCFNDDIRSWRIDALDHLDIKNQRLRFNCWFGEIW
jgi:hypothetical protein